MHKFNWVFTLVITKKLLYIGNLREGGNGQDRKKMFERHGYQVIEFNIRTYKDSGNRVSRALGGRYHWGLGVVRMNRALREISDRGGYDVVFVDKGTWLYPETLEQLIQKSTSGLAIHFSPDSQFISNRSRHFYNCVPLYELVITTKSYEIEYYQEIVVNDFAYIHQGYGERIASFDDGGIEKTNDVVFIGHYEPHYGKHITAASNVARTSVWGHGWKKQASQGKIGRAEFKGDGVYGSEYGATLCSSKIALGLLSKSALDKNTTRSFEIPATGTFLLAERTDEHQSLFEEGKEAEFFSNPDEMCEKIEYYLEYEDKRERIASSGRRKGRTCGYAADQQFEPIISWIDKRLMQC